VDEWRTVTVAPERLVRWLEGFGVRHGRPEARLDGATLTLVAPDGAVAALTTRWPEMPAGDDPVATFVALATRPRRVGVLLVRRERHAVGLADGGVVVTVRAGRHYVQGRTKAGGWSQQRYARRRDNQARHAYAAAADDAAQVLEPEAASLEGLLRGGDAAGLDAVLADPRLVRTAALARRIPLPRLEVGDPTREALAAFPARYAAVTVRLNQLA